MMLSPEEHERRKTFLQRQKDEKAAKKPEKIKRQKAIQQAVRKICADRGIEGKQIKKAIPAAESIFKGMTSGFSEDTALAVARWLEFDKVQDMLDEVKLLPPAHTYTGRLAPNVRKIIGGVISQRMQEQNTSVKVVAGEAGVRGEIGNQAQSGDACSIDNLHKILRALGEEDPQAVIDAAIEQHRAEYRPRRKEIER